MDMMILALANKQIKIWVRFFRDVFFNFVTKNNNKFKNNLALKKWQNKLI